MQFRAGLLAPVLGLAFVMACVTAPDDDPAAQRSRLDVDATIARVANPPPASDLVNLPGDLRAAPVPQPSGIDAYVRDRVAAVRLGKALFWDMRVGSDGVQACASCHFRAGADPRSKNQVSPGLKRVPEADLAYHTTTGPNDQLTEASFPLTRLAVPPGTPGYPLGQRGALDSATDSNDVVSSQGIAFLDPGADPDGFQVGGLKTRRVAARNAPSVINAVFNHRQFWDGRAENVFNGVNHLGARDPAARVLRAGPGPKGTPVPVQVALTNASLASQALGPIISDLEQARPGRTVQQVAVWLTKETRAKGKKSAKLRPLAGQKVAATDSVLGPISDQGKEGTGLKKPDYVAMIRDAFKKEWWESEVVVSVAADGTTRYLDRPSPTPPPGTEEYTLAEYNFGLFFGIAIQLYEATLVSDDTPWDRFRRLHPSATDGALNPWVNEHPEEISRLALFGASLFNDRTRGAKNVRCSNCHESAELTDNASDRVAAALNGGVRNRDGNIIDKGFNNIGIRPTDDDLGVGGSDAFGPLSLSRRLFSSGAPVGQTFDGAIVSKGFGVEGAFKVPSLRNVALTAPYFHNGDVSTLRDAVALYGRGGNVAPIRQTDGTVIEPIGVPDLTSDEIDAIVAFLESLTDERVLYQRAPFDHPQLFVPNGHPGGSSSTAGANGFASDLVYELGAVGAAGGAPVPGFLEPPFR